MSDTPGSQAPHEDPTTSGHDAAQTTTVESAPTEPAPTEAAPTEPADLAPPLATLIATVRAGVARGASPEARAAGATAYRSIQSTQYAELEHVLVTSTDRFRRRRKIRVRAGDVLGHARCSALQVRFGLTQLIDGEWICVDPREAMHSWALLPWIIDPAPSAATPRAA